MPTLYEVLGPIRVPCLPNAKGAKFIQKAAVLERLEDEDVADLRGCYMFCIRKGHGAISPYYR